MGQQREINSPTSVSPPTNFVKNTILPSPSSENFDIPKSNVILQPPVHIDNVAGSPLMVSKLLAKRFARVYQGSPGINKADQDFPRLIRDTSGPNMPHSRSY